VSGEESGRAGLFRAGEKSEIDPSKKEYRREKGGKHSVENVSAEGVRKGARMNTEAVKRG